MPNWCNNTLTVSGNETDITKFYEDNRGMEEGSDKEEELLFSKALPVPEDQKENWYEWRIENWGTKWEPDGTDATPNFDGLRSEVHYSFSTAWAPPLPWLLAVAEKYPTLHFEMQWLESGMCFAGKAEGQGGSISVEEYENPEDPGYKAMYIEFYGEDSWDEAYPEGSEGESEGEDPSQEG